MAFVWPCTTVRRARFPANRPMCFAAALVASSLTVTVLPGCARAAPLAIVAGNRNIALFLTALPSTITDPLLLFIGCYQVPMFLTPIMLNRLYRR